MTLNLTLHCGANTVDYGQVASTETPAATATHTPVAHRQVVESLRSAFDQSDIGIRSEAHGLTKDGARYFGLFQIGPKALRWSGGLPISCPDTDNGGGLVIGVRNSHDRSFAVGLALGYGVFVCDNLSFDGEVKLSRKHTRHVYRDMPGLITRALGRLNDQRRRQELRLAKYREFEVTDSQANNLIIDALDVRALTAQSIPHVLQEWRSPRHPEFCKDGKTLWRLYNAITEQWKGNAATRTLTRSQQLHGLLDARVGLAV